MSFDKKDFNEFINEESIQPPKGLSDNILKMVDTDLNPSAWSVFAKLSLIHFFSALLTLSICPQFGFRVFGSGTGLMGVFMNLGYYGCMIACGIFFLGTSFLIAVITLQSQEIKVLRKHRWVQIVSLASLSLGAFIMLDAQIVFGFALAWIIGTFIGAFSVLELGWLVRRRIVL